MIAQKKPNAVDVHVGNKLRQARLMGSMSQTDLANGVGLTFQQIQKYEKGTNRIGASRLQQFCHILKVPPGYFFEGSPVATPKSNDPDVAITAFLSTSTGLAIVQTAMRLDAKAQKAVAEFLNQWVLFTRRAAFNE
jgi:transcriptional regulator with XRE-family HTH domain